MTPLIISLGVLLGASTLHLYGWGAVAVLLGLLLLGDWAADMRAKA